MSNTQKLSAYFQTEFPTDILENVNGQDIEYKGIHVYYNLDGGQVQLNQFVQPTGKIKLINSIATTDGINLRVRGSGSIHSRTCAGALGFINFHSNCVEKNAQYVGLFSLPCTDQGFNILPENFDRIVSGFAARRVIDDTVWNHRDCYMAPNINHSQYINWLHDCYVLSMFESKSHQTSIKGEVDGEEYEFVNQFYPLTKEETYDLLSLQKKANFKNDARYIRSSGKLDELTPEGQAVLDAFKACLKASASARSEYAKDNPTLQVARWDCGWRQLKGLFAEACPEELKVLKERFNVLKDKMRPLVYELGFLKA